MGEHEAEDSGEGGRRPISRVLRQLGALGQAAVRELHLLAARAHQPRGPGLGRGAAGLLQARRLRLAARVRRSVTSPSPPLLMGLK